MKQRRVRFTATAHRNVRREKAWWIESRIHTETFGAEFEEALRILAILPGAGTAYLQADIPGLRRLYVPKVACHLYDTFDENKVLIAPCGAQVESAALDSSRSPSSSA